ncbi:hypothetical protein IC229_13365 [Spirosoma sp. BT702]|uniref:Uncharacterized protein n=1 Tax=Spirosoma profusum TaxID=2771354 RepID=A0A926XW80_9BACT|nr:hypothetical protein [Spirosoma profusum]MBD2701634.1 hypothetical protein [Spirosoma profusum]
MKTWLYGFILIIVTVGGCKKSGEPNPDLAATIDGLYNVTSIKQGTTVTTFPSNGQSSATIAFIRQSTNSSSMQFVTKQGTATTASQAGTAYLYGTVDNVDIFSEAARVTKIGSATKASITLTVSSSGVVTIIEGSR